MPDHDPDPHNRPAELEVALEAAAAAARISRSYYRGNLSITTKADQTPVTQADVECEQAIRDIILGAYPEHGFYGEETGKTQADAEHLWLVDPIDGTKAFVRQYPFFSTQIALMSAGWPRLGELVAASYRIRGYGDFYHYHLLAAGKIDAVIESDVNILDIAALAVIVEEAGGRFTDLNGNEAGLETRSVLAANPRLHEQYLEKLSGFVN